MKSVLFVDDEPGELASLRRELREAQADGGWEVEFADGGAKGLHQLAARPFDVVIADAQIRGLDSAQFLDEAARRHPQSVRVLLFGEGDHALLRQSLRLAAAQHYLAKPCDVEMLRATVARACALRDLLANRTLQQLVEQMPALPSLPSLYAELLDELKSPNASVKRLGDIIAQDLGMTAKILQLVNSAMFGVRRRISHPADAARYLGVDALMSLALSAHVFSQFSQTRVPQFSPQALWDHSMSVGVLAKRIATVERFGPKLAEESFTAGLLHDAGKLVLAANLPDWFNDALDLAREEQLSISEAERQVFGATHAEVGAYLLGLWGLPEAVVEAVAFHHQPSLSGARQPGALLAVHIANTLEHEPRAANQRQPALSPLDPAFLAQLGVAERLIEWRQLRGQLLEEVA